MDKVKCKVCHARHFYPSDQVIQFSSYSGDLFVVEEVLQPLAREVRDPRIWNHVCLPCLEDRIERQRESVSGLTYDNALG